jgi:transposase-like protein
LSCRDIEDLLAERGIAVSYEPIRLWCVKFGSKYAKWLRRRHQGYGDTFFIDEVFVKIQASNTIFGVRSIRMVKWLMCFCRRVETARQRRVSSSAYSKRMAVSREK